MNKPFIEIKADSFILHAFEIHKPDNFEFPINYPNCCEGHKSDLKWLEEYFAKFPYCCDEHLNFFKKFSFDKNIVYKNLPIRILNTCLYTEHHIKTNIQKEDWYEDTTEYIDFAIRSLGQPAVGFHIYIHIIESLIKNKASQIPLNKKKAILNYISELSKYTPTNEKTDMNLLFTIYEKWLNFFPFELPFFSPLKPELSKTLPFVKGVTKTNRHLGQVSVKMVTPSELVDSLFKRTVHILSLIDTVKLVNDGKINDTSKINIDIINTTHKYKQRMLLNTFNKGESKYIKTIKKWLENEKEYFSSIIPLINQNTLPPSKIETPKYFLIKDAPTRYSKAQTLFEKLASKKLIDINSKADFINAFTGSEPKNKVNWIGQKGDLTSFVKILKSYSVIEYNNQIWVSTANTFSCNGINFKAESYKDGKKTKNELEIKNIVKSVL